MSHATFRSLVFIGAMIGIAAPVYAQQTPDAPKAAPSETSAPVATTAPAATAAPPKHSFKDLVLAGPAPAPLLRAETFYRYQIMLRTRAMTACSRELAVIIQKLTLPEDVTLAVDIDPVNLS